MKILKVPEENFKKMTKTIIKSIKSGEVIVCPTDTVYGLIADAVNEKAVKKLFKIKKRKAKKPIPIFVKDIKTAKKFAYIYKKQEKFLESIWPGKVTVVLKRKSKLPKILSAGTDTLGLRIPNYKLVNALLKKLNGPLTGTSANISGKDPSTKIKEVMDQFKKQKLQPNLILDAGNLKESKPSTVIDLTGSKPKILRK